MRTNTSEHEKVKSLINLEKYISKSNNLKSLSKHDENKTIQRFFFPKFQKIPSHNLGGGVYVYLIAKVTCFSRNDSP